MSRVERPLVVDVFPDLANELQHRLRALAEPQLADSVPNLRVVERCRCGDDFCATFYTAPPPSGSYGASHRNVDLDADEGVVILDVVDEEIACVEILYRRAFRGRLHELLP